VLHRYLVNKEIYSSYEPLIYPGINVKYYYNINNNTGICNCSKYCDGKGTGDGDGKCKRITIAIFESGKILITGKITKMHLKLTYNFITVLMINNKSLFILK
tara:strand:+ start:52 stop:357 length:306 start_codon:yes stop_codon:yes gene_type:complete